MPEESAKGKRNNKTHIVGGSFIGGNVNTGGGDFIGRDKNISGGEENNIFDGNIHDSNIVVGNHNKIVGSQDSFLRIYDAIENSSYTHDKKEEVTAEIKDMEREVEKGELADESFLSRRLHNIRRMAPDIADVIFSTLANPALAVSVVIKKIADKMKNEAEDNN